MVEKSKSVNKPEMTVDDIIREDLKPSRFSKPDVDVMKTLTYAHFGKLNNVDKLDTSTPLENVANNNLTKLERFIKSAFGSKPKVKKKLRLRSRKKRNPKPRRSKSKSKKSRQRRKSKSKKSKKLKRPKRRTKKSRK